MSRNIAGIFLLCVAAGLAVSLTSRDCSAQRVRVDGGVHVRAPFVRVDVYPYGGVHVRAPFTALDIPGRAYYYEPMPVIIERRIAEPSYPSAAELAAMDDAQLDRTLRSISQRLYDRLNRFNTGETWQRYLRLPDEVFADSSPQRRDALAKTLDRFDNVASNSQYAMITRLPAFAAMQATLVESLSRIDESQTAAGPPAEDLPLPAPEQPIQNGRDGPFLQPKPRQ